MGRQLEREEDAIFQDFEDGEISAEQREKELRELYLDYRVAAEEAARDAYERELDRW